MPLTTRVWGAGKVLFLCGALLLTYVVFAAAAMRMALKTREVVVPELAGQDRQRRVGGARGAGPDAEGRGRPQGGPEGAGGTDPGAGTASGRADAAPAERPGLDQRRAAVDHRSGARRRVRADGAVARDAGRIRASGQRPRFARSTTPPGPWSRRIRRPRASRTRFRCSSIAASAARRTSCRTSSASTATAPSDVLRTRGIPRVGRRRSPVSWRARRRRPAAEPAGGLSDRARRTDLDRGQPVSVLIAPSLLSADFARSATDIAKRRARRRGSAAPRRHGRPLRAEHHVRPAGRAGASTRSRRVPLDVHLMIRGAGSLHRGVRRGRRGQHRGPRRGAAAPAPDRAAHQEAGRQGGRRDQSRRRRSARSKRSPATSTTCW